MCEYQEHFDSLFHDPFNLYFLKKVGICKNRKQTNKQNKCAGFCFMWDLCVRQSRLILQMYCMA